MDTLPALRGVLLLEGVIFIVMGLLMLLLPGVSTISVTLVTGWLLVIGGLIQGYRAIRNRHAPGFGVSLLSAVLFLIIGIMFIMLPMAGMLTLTYLVLTFFLLEGASKFVMAFDLKGQHQRWIGVLVSGFVSWVAALLVLLGLPYTAMWVIGFLLGIYFLVLGISMAMLGFGLPKLGRVA